MKLILLGAPGAGKGTQAEKICEKLHIPTISTGNIIRAALKNGTEMGLKAKAYMEAGQLVPDEVVIGIIKDRLKDDDCKNGFILDGFPRTIPQAQALVDMGIDIDKVIDIEVPDEKIIARMSGRRVCSKCGAIYHTATKPSKVEGVCDVCGGPLQQRKDDTVEQLKVRMDEYEKSTKPVIDFYEARGVVTHIDASKSRDLVFAQVQETLEKIR